MSGSFPGLRPTVVAADGTATFNGALRLPIAITIVPGGSASGTGAVTAKGPTAPGVVPASEAVKDAAGEDLTVDVTVGNTQIIDGAGWLSEISVAGSDFTLLVTDSTVS